MPFLSMSDHNNASNRPFLCVMMTTPYSKASRFNDLREDTLIFLFDGNIFFAFFAVIDIPGSKQI